MNNRKMTPAKLIVMLFIAALSVTSATTSFIFFLEVFGDGTLTPESVTTGLVGVLILDGALIAWVAAYLGLSENGERKTASIVGAVVGFAGSAIASAMVFLSRSSAYEVTGAQSENATIAMAIILVVHLALAFWFGLSSEDAKKKTQANDMISEANYEAALGSKEKFEAWLPMLSDAIAIKRMLEVAEQFGGNALAQQIRAEIEQQTGKPVHLPSVTSIPLPMSTPANDMQHPFRINSNENHVVIHPKPDEEADFLPHRPKSPSMNGHSQNGSH